MTMFRPATRSKLKLRMAIDGPSGSGKTYTGLRFAFALAAPAEGEPRAPGKVAVLDTEHGAASKYQGMAPDGIPWNFDVCELAHFAPTTYTAAIQEAARLGYSVLLIDSLSHAWEGQGGALDQVDQAAGRNKGNTFTAWRDVTPQHREMIEAILSAPLHIVATMRTKMAYEIEQDERGKMKPVKIGTKPVQREGMEYEFDVVADMDIDHLFIVSKSRCPAIDGRRVSRPDANFLIPVKQWLDAGVRVGGSGSPAPAPQFTTPTAEPRTTTQLQVEMPAQRGTPGVYGESLSERATPEHFARLKKLMDELAMPAEVRKAAVRKAANGNGPELLTKGAAEELAGKLQGLLVKKQAEQAIENGGAKEPAAADPTHT
jgi:hypothetical protein